MHRRVYTDGSCLGNPGAGGWAVAFSMHDHICGSVENTTNNIMEMTAVVNALEECLTRGILDIQLFTDSNYVSTESALTPIALRLAALCSLLVVAEMSSTGCPESMRPLAQKLQINTS